MGRGSGLATASPPVSIFVFVRDTSARSEAVEAVLEAGFTPRTVGALDELLALSTQDPDAVVLIDATGSLEDGVGACRRLRELPDGDRPLLCLITRTRSADDEARAIEAGADTVWDASVRPSVLRAVVHRRARRRARHEAAAEPPRASKRVSRVRVSGRGERRFRALFDNALDIVAVVGEGGDIHVANLAVRTVLGRLPDALAGTSMWDLVHPDDAPLARQMLVEALALDAVAFPTTVRAKHQDGSWVALEMTAQSLLDDPSIGGLLLHARDVTERVWVGAALQESERRFREIFENMLDGVVQIDEVTCSLVQANPAFCRIVGCARQDIFGLQLLDLFPAEDQARVGVVLDEHISGKRRVSESLRVRHRDGSLRYVDIGTSRMDLSGVRTMIAVIRDVTVRRETERTREMFLAVVAHELRTPVAVIRNGVEILRSKVATMPVDDRTTLVTVLSEEVERLTRLVGDALDVGAIQAGSLALRPLRVALAPIVAAVAARIGLQFQAEANLYLEATDAFVDPLRFEQVLTNVLDNAWRHSGSSATVDVTLSVVGDFARISVKDDGPGFPPELRDSIFERVFVPNDRPTCGIGIGLWLARRLIDSMGGEISADLGGNGRGACVTFTVPLP
jgi:PAS domain S-box-containing protein